MKWTEADPLPPECLACREGDCTECDTAGKRWYLSEREELLLRKKGIIQAIERLMRQLDEIDAALLRLESPKHLHFPPPVVK